MFVPIVPWVSSATPKYLTFALTNTPGALRAAARELVLSLARSISGTLAVVSAC
jgi:hypothetical protein